MFLYFVKIATERSTNATETTIEPQKSVPDDLSGAGVNENPAISHIISSDTNYLCLQAVLERPTNA